MTGLELKVIGVSADKATRVLNLGAYIDEEVEVQDDIESWRDFSGSLTTSDGRKVAFRIPARDYADNAKLKAELFNAGGSGLVFHCGIDELRKAVSSLGESKYIRASTT